MRDKHKFYANDMVKIEKVSDNKGISPLQLGYRSVGYLVWDITPGSVCLLTEGPDGEGQRNFNSSRIIEVKDDLFITNNSTYKISHLIEDGKLTI